MARRRKSPNSALLIFIALFLAVLVISQLVAWWNSLALPARIALVVVPVAGLSSGAGLVTLYFNHRKRQRALAWKRALILWGQSRSQNRTPSNPLSACHLTPAQLEQFTARLFQQMGYRVEHTGRSGDHGIDVRLISPLGEVEVVQCKQWGKPVGEPEVRDLAGSMLDEGARRGFLVAPNGFSEAAREWARGKPILLVDDVEIGRMVETAFGDRTYDLRP